MKRLFIIILLISTGVAFKSHAQFKKVNSHGMDIYYRIIGNGTPLLIIGGGPGDNSDRYLSLCELLAPNNQCILVDQRGTGKSMPTVLDSSTISIELTLSDFENVRKDAGLKDWAVLGFSYGGYLASLYTNFYPNSISHLILLGSMGLNTDVFDYFFDNITTKLNACDLERYDYWNDSTRIAQDPHHALVERIRAMMPGYFYDRKKSLNVSQTMYDADFNFAMGEWIWKDVQKRNLDLTTMNPRYNKSVLILHGRQDPVGESVPRILSQYYKNSTLVFVEKAGHYSWIEQPDTVYNSINKFFEKNK
jgi:proline iminopeptidase